ncbi:hypothetical protein [Streptomyces decoyicus]|uniref:hypothetical protein n=1 Tax=Streptomyces decoyicus TaxID=249567 RepID=UPI0037FAE739
MAVGHLRAPQVHGAGRSSGEGEVEVGHLHQVVRDREPVTAQALELAPVVRQPR